MRRDRFNSNRDVRARRTASRQRKLAGLISGSFYVGPLLLAFVLLLLPVPDAIAPLVMFGSYALVMLLATIVGVVIAWVAPPLPRVSDRSILMRRVTWFGRFVLAAILLLWATFVNDRWAALAASLGYGWKSFVVDTVLYPVACGILVAIVWLAVDLARLRIAGRQQALAGIGLRGRALTVSLALTDPLWMIPANLIVGLISIVALVQISGAM